MSVWVVSSCLEHLFFKQYIANLMSIYEADHVYPNYLLSFSSWNFISYSDMHLGLM